MSHVLMNGLQIPVVTTDQMRKVDMLMIEDFGIQLIQMMENAGRNLAELTRRLSGNSVDGKAIIVAAGKGNNGGGGLVAARHLYNWGADVTVLAPESALKDVPRIQLGILEKLPIEIKKGDAAVAEVTNRGGDIVIDALLGYGLSSSPRGWTGKIIESMNSLDAEVVALDVPSGLDSTTGEIYNPCIKANATMTLALPKTGLLKPEAKSVAGEIYLADIGVPGVLYRKMDIEVGPIFQHDTIIKIEPSEGGLS